MALDWKSVEQTQTFVKEGVDIILEHGLDGWESVKQQLEEWREGAGLDGPREATVAGWGIVDAFMAGGDDKSPTAVFLKKYGADGYWELRRRMEPYQAGRRVEEINAGLKELVDAASKKGGSPSGSEQLIPQNGHPQLADIKEYFFIGVVENEQGREWPAMLVPAPKKEGYMRMHGWTLFTFSPDAANNYGRMLQMMAEQVRKTRGED